MARWDWDFETFDWNPWRELARMGRRANDLVDTFSGNVFGVPFPPVNVSCDSQKVVVTAEIPGVKPEDLDLSVQGEVLTLSGSRGPEKLEGDERFRRHERGHGAFLRTVALPFAVDGDKVEASCVNGVLSVSLPRSEASRPRKIEIKG